MPQHQLNTSLASSNCRSRDQSAEDVKVRTTVPWAGHAAPYLCSIVSRLTTYVGTPALALLIRSPHSLSFRSPLLRSALRLAASRLCHLGERSSRHARPISLARHSLRSRRAPGQTPR